MSIKNINIDEAKLQALLDKWLFKVAVWYSADMKRIVWRTHFDRWEHRQSINAFKKGGKVWVKSDTWQAVIFEKGRKSRKLPNLDAIAWWLARKWSLNAKKTARYDSLSWLQRKFVRTVAKSIADNGIKPQEWYSKTILSQKEKYQRILSSVFR